METSQIHRAEQTRADSHRGSSPGPITAFAWFVACLLILLGVAFELGMLGLGPYNSSGVWLYSVLGQNMWVMLTNFVIPELRETLKIWPLILVSLGSAILLIVRHRHQLRPAVVPSSTMKEINAD
jgi:hypothetical protein